MMNSPKSSASSQPHSQPTRPSTLWASPQLTASEIDSLRSGKKSIADYVQKELLVQLKARHLEHLLPQD
jgi:hypothetical protein